MGQVVYSFNCKVYGGGSSRATWGTLDATTGITSGAAPTLTEFPNVMDIEIPMEDGEVDVTTRGNKGFKATMQGLRDVAIDVPVVKDASDAGYIALKKAHLTRTTVPLAFLDGDKATAGTEGFWADFSVTKMKHGQKLDGVETCTFTCKPGYSAVPPEWVKVS